MRYQKSIGKSDHEAQLGLPYSRVGVTPAVDLLGQSPSAVASPYLPNSAWQLMQRCSSSCPGSRSQKCQWRVDASLPASLLALHCGDSGLG